MPISGSSAAAYGGSTPPEEGISCGSPYGAQSTYAVFELGRSRLAVQDVGFVPDAVGVPVEFDGWLAVRSPLWPPVLKPPPPTALRPVRQVAVRVGDRTSA
jgi:hypothetical protein